MKRGFTLLELVVVILIIGVLATLGLTQYGRLIEKSRGAEARAILGDIRKLAAAHRMEYRSLDGTDPDGNPVPIFDDTRAGIGAELDEIPIACRTTHYFSYLVTDQSTDGLRIEATRCGIAGKTPAGGPAADDTLDLTVDFGTGEDIWGGTGNY